MGNLQSVIEAYELRISKIEKMLGEYGYRLSQVEKLVGELTYNDVGSVDTDGKKSEHVCDALRYAFPVYTENK